VTGIRAAGSARLSRRAFVAQTALLAAAVLAPVPRAAVRAGLMPADSPAAPALVLDTLNGVAAYVVPGDDRYSIAQRVSSLHPGGVAARAGEGLHATLAAVAPGIVDATVYVLNGLARAVDPGADVRAAGAGLAAPFAALSFTAKEEVFVRLSQSVDESLRLLGGILPPLGAFLAYSEYGVLTQGAAELASRPVGWQLTGYEGVADGRNAFRGYYGGRRQSRSRVGPERTRA
jgi:hypothetical protein